VFIEALAAFFAIVMRFLGHSLLVSFSLLLSILYRGGVDFVSHKVALCLERQFTWFSLHVFLACYLFGRSLLRDGPFFFNCFG
jgi:hypothetical protein